MVDSTKQCEICGREPAKYCNFKAHQGFVFFRREIDVCGTFCRDCAIEAYMHARGISLKGMWFSPTTIFLGAISAAWDSVKLLDLPPEVTDAPWVWHKVACPYCSHANTSCAGNCECEKCGKLFAVLSCIHCKTVNIAHDRSNENAIGVHCRSCSKSTDAPTAARNAPRLLIGRMLAEVAGQVHDASDEVPIDEWLAAFTGLEELTDRTLIWLSDLFDLRLEDQKTNTLRASLKMRQIEAIHIAMDMAFHLSTGRQRKSLETLAARFGIEIGHPAEEFGEFELGDAFEILEIPNGSTKSEVERAYRKLATQLHPDRHRSESEEDQANAIQRMKTLNAAYEAICKFLVSGEADASRDNPWRDPGAAAEVRRRREAARAKSVAEELQATHAADGILRREHEANREAETRHQQADANPKATSNCDNITTHGPSQAPPEVATDHNQNTSAPVEPNEFFGDIPRATVAIAVLATCAIVGTFMPPGSFSTAYKADPFEDEQVEKSFSSHEVYGGSEDLEAKDADTFTHPGFDRDIRLDNVDASETAKEWKDPPEIEQLSTEDPSETRQEGHWPPGSGRTRFYDLGSLAIPDEFRREPDSEPVPKRETRSARVLEVRPLGHAVHSRRKLSPPVANEPAKPNKQNDSDRSQNPPRGRRWVSKDGRFSRIGDLDGYNRSTGQVTIFREGFRSISVNIRDLCDKDQAYVKSMSFLYE